MSRDVDNPPGVVVKGDRTGPGKDGKRDGKADAVIVSRLERNTERDKRGSDVANYKPK